MTKIQSNKSDAQSYAVKIKQGSSNLSGIGQAQQDEQTTVSGNANAHEAMGAVQAARQGISTALSDMVTNIHSVAEEFEAVDQQAADSID
ncbi:TIGR04197 family type VII secretion effector [Streptococcus panodentis]|uniref:TIGR04197 family type VII secretion effector n=1 Tax=Streptococcus panodentis TaxID=1581472 RepID=A0ABS5AYR4_9STRE|nr:TIGR04197 family type VII secretion effector [Streptococcus panodentis]MBP2621717.1 TIGR04197 family type VII secretion effector [Streptococcus panodentis]